MTKITSNLNCGNSPKMRFLRDFNIAFAKGDVKFLTDNVTQEIVWNKIGIKKICGKDQFQRDLHHMHAESVAELVLENIISHGKTGAANGIIKMQSGKHFAFSDIYEFNGARGEKLKSITSHVIEIK